MTFLRAVALILVAVLLAACSEGFDIEHVDRSVVRVQHILEYQGRQVQGGHGTGFVLNDQGYVVTNQHVVNVQGRLPEGVRLNSIVVPDGSWDRRLQAEIVWQSQELDLAILHVPELRRTPVTLSAVQATSEPERGENIYTIGFPGAADQSPAAMLESTVTSGIVSKVTPGRGTEHGALRQMIQHTAAMSPGNSGGPLFNECNQVIGINTYVATSRFRLVRREDGEMVAVGAAVSGVNYSPHVTSLIRALTTEPALRNIEFNSISRVCVGPSGMPVEIYILIALVTVLALASMVLALVRRRGSREVIKVVESYSQWIRRRGEGGEQAQTGEATAAPRRRRASEPPEQPPAELDEGWVLEGSDGAGKPVKIELGHNELERASKGADKGLIVGRSNSLSNKVLTDGSVSRRHARLLLMEGGVGIEDLNSTYGTIVDGNTLKPYSAVALKEGARLQLGDVKLTVKAK